VQFKLFFVAGTETEKKKRERKTIGNTKAEIEKEKRDIKKIGDTKVEAET
jgi:hypothetical protein